MIFQQLLTIGIVYVIFLTFINTYAYGLIFNHLQQ